MTMSGRALNKRLRVMPHEEECLSARCTLLSLQAAAEVRGRQSYLRVVMQKVKVDRSDAYLKKKMQDCTLSTSIYNRQLLHRKAVAVTEPETKHPLWR